MAHKIYIIIILLVLYLIPTPVFAKETPKKLKGVTTISPVVLKKWLDSKKQFFLLDARKSVLYQKGHIPKAVNCPVDNELSLKASEIKKTRQLLENCSVLKQLDKKIKIVTYCNALTCFHSPKAALALLKMKHPNIYWLREGFSIWKKKGFPVEK